MATIEEAAAELGRSPVTIRAWIKAGAPVVRRGSRGVAWDLDPQAMAAWHRAREASRREGAGASLEETADALDGFGDPAVLRSASPNQLKLAYDLIRVRRQIAKDDRLLVSAEDVEMAVAEALQRLRDRLTAVPDILARQHGVAPDVIDALRTIIDDALREAAEDLAGERRGTEAAAAAEAGRAEADPARRPGDKPARGRQRRRLRRETSPAE